MNDQPDNLLQDIPPAGDEVISPRPWLIAQPPGPRGLSQLAAILLTVCFHVYVFAFLPAVLFYEVLVEPPEASAEWDDDIGNDPDWPIYYVSDRIEEVSIPGTVHSEQAVGIFVCLDQPPATIPPPPGVTLVQEVKVTGATPGLPSGTPGNSVTLAVPPALTGNFPLGELDKPPPQGPGPAGGLGGPAIRLSPFSGQSGATRERMIAESGYSLRAEKQPTTAPAPSMQPNPAVQPAALLGVT